VSITAELEDGRTLEFPDGTDTAVIQRTVKKMVGQQEPSTARTALQSVAEVGAGLSPVGAAQKVGEFVKPSIFPTAGSIALPAAGTAIFGPANIPFIPLERAVGSGIGTLGNWATGITEPSKTEMALSLGLPLAMEYGANIARTVGNFLPSSAGPGALNTLAPLEATSKIAGMRGVQNASSLFTQAAQQGGTVPVTKTKALMTSVLSNPDISSAEKQAFRKVVKESGLSEFLAQDIRGLNPARVQRVLNATGQLVPSAQGYEGGHLKKLFGALSDDLDDAASASGAGAATLKLARDTYKRESVLNTLDKEIADAFKINRGQGAQGQFNANKIINTLKDSSEGTGKFFSQAFTKGEQKDLIGFFEFLNEIPGLGAPAGVARGSEAFWKSAAKVGGTATIGAGVGSIVPGVGTAVGAGIGAAIPPSLETIKLMRMAWHMQGGKEMVKGLLANSDGTVTPRVLATLGAFISGQAATRAPSQTPTGIVERPTTAIRPMPLEQ